MYWTSSSGRIELKMTLEQARSVSHSGQCDEDVEYLCRVPAIAKQLAKIDKDTLSAELKEYGAWDETERADHDANLLRLVWIAGGDIAEENKDVPRKNAFADPRSRKFTEAANNTLKSLGF